MASKFSEFNATDYTVELESAGVPKEQAAIHARALTRVLGGYALGKELEALRVELGAQLTELRAEFAAFKVEVNARFVSLEAKMNAMEASIRAEIRAEITNVRAEVKIVRAEVRLLRWIVSISLGLQTAVLLKLIFP
jgi:hypothetical protein